MNNDFVYDQTLKACLKSGASQTQSRNAAQLTMERYRKGQYNGKVSKMIEQAIKEAVKNTPKKERGKSK